MNDIMNLNYTTIPSELRTPSDSEIIPPPVQTLIQELPFDQLEWINFEKLCLRLVELDENVEDHRLYGTRGQSQEGIDLYARPKFKQKYSVYQCKRVKDFTPSLIEKAVSKFLKGEWADKSDRFVLCTSDTFNKTQRLKTIENQSEILKNKGIRLILWDKDNLSRKLKDYPEIVNEFFGREWVKHFCGDDAANELKNRLDVNEVIKLRKMLLDFYKKVFHEHGLAFSSFINSKAPSFKKRFVFPDIDKKGSVLVENFHKNPKINNKEFLSRPDGFKLAKNAPQLEFSSSEAVSSLQYNQRQGFEEWLKNSDYNIILGSPGSGKSTLLKFMAIDLLSDSPQLDQISEKWAKFIPIWIPFALWTKQISIQNIENYSLQNLIKKWLKSWKHEHIWPLIEKGIDDQKVLLLVDGLDEWSSEDAAKLALNRLKIFVKDSKIPLIITSRPHGFERLGIREMEWQTGYLSDFSTEQQKELCKIWFTFLIKDKCASSGEEIVDEEIEKDSDIETEAFMNELRKSSELIELVKNPLLLSLLIYHKFKKYHLPQSRFMAYNSIIQHLIAEHPQMRAIAADVTTTSSNELTDEDNRLILEYLAYYIQKNYNNGLVELEDAKNNLKNYLMNNGDFNLAPYQARRYSDQFLKVSEDVIGVIVKQSHTEIGFLHRVFQEYLAASYISKKSLDNQKFIIQKFCSNPQWKEVVLSLFHLTNDPKIVKEFIDHIQIISGDLNHFEKYVVDLILFEIAFGDYNCPIGIAEELADCAFEKVEFDFWMTHRERVLNLILLGLNSKIKDKIQTKLKSWFPCREKWRAHIFASMEKWPKTQSAIDCLWKGMYDEELVNKRSAASALVVIGKDDPEIKERMISLAKNAIDPKIRAVAIEALINDWPNCEELDGILNANFHSISPEISLITIIGRINKKIHTKEDLDVLLFLGSNRGALDYEWKDRISFAILKGWPDSDEIKKECIRIVTENLRNDLNYEIAFKILLQGYPRDEEVAHAFSDFFKNKKHPMPLPDHEYYALLAHNFKENQQLIESIEEWALKKENLTMNISAISILSSIGHSSKIKSILLSSLDKIDFTSHWAAQALIENWGMDDFEVENKLTKIAMGSNKEASRIAHLFPKIINNKVKCRERLIELLNERNAYFSSILLGLKELNDTLDDPEVVDIILKTPSLLEKRFLDDVLGNLIRYYPLNEKVKKIAKNELLKRDGVFGIVAHQYGNDVDIRDKIIKMACPLPSRLREIVVKYLGDLGTSDKFTISLLKLYDYDEDEIVKTQASISYYNLLKTSNNNIKGDLKYLSESIVCYGMDYEERRKAAFCGLLILNRLDIMFKAKESNRKGDEIRVLYQLGA